MPISLEEHDYIGLSEVSAMENSDKSSISCGVNEKNSKGLNLKATELRLGLPGSESLEREREKSGVVHGFEDKNNVYSSSSSSSSHGLLKGLVFSGAKRGFADTINGGTGTGKWGLTVGVGSEVGLDKNGVLFSPRGGVNGGAKGSESYTTQQSSVAKNAVKEGVVVPQSPKAAVQEKKPQISTANSHGVAPAAKAQVVGWPPIRSSRKNSMATNPPKIDQDADAKSGAGCLYVKVSMDGAPYLRKVDLKTYHGYKDLSLSLEKMFSYFTIGQCGTQGVPNGDGLTENRKDLLHGSEYVLTFEDKDGDWMLVGDVPWEMFTDTCKRLRIMKSSDAIGLAPRATEKCKNRN